MADSAPFETSLSQALVVPDAGPTRVLQPSGLATALQAPTGPVNYWAVALPKALENPANPRALAAANAPVGASYPVSSQSSGAFPTKLARDALDIITRSYLEPLAPLQLTAAGLNQLRLAEPALRVTAENDALVLRWNGELIAREKPANTSNDAALSAARRLVDVVVARSLVFARFSGQELSQALLGGMLSQLDIYSRAISADELAELQSGLSTTAHGGTSAPAAVKPAAPSSAFPVLAIPAFTATTAADVRATLLPLIQSGADGVVIDLRGCGGGNLEQAAATADLFVKRGVVLDMKARDRTFAKHLEAEVTSPLEQLRVVILVDGGTASAAEEFAATLGDVGRAVLLGHSTVGKGRAQAIIPLHSGEGLVLTVARFAGPTGATIDGVGLAPAVCENEHGQFVLTDEELGHVRRISPSAGREALLRVCRSMRSKDPREVAVAQRLLSDKAAFARAVTRQHRLADAQNDTMKATTRQDIRY